jgi:Prolyl oligopeptidase family
MDAQRRRLLAGQAQRRYRPDRFCHQDDNVHFQNAERLVNALVKHGKQFQYMAYPNRSHGIDEGEGTTQHLRQLFTQYLREKCVRNER